MKPPIRTTCARIICDGEERGASFCARLYAESGVKNSWAVSRVWRFSNHDWCLGIPEIRSDFIEKYHC
ncbi:unnamed protein product [Onchocerca ochengi]|uniref:DUF551 domain-containing protein n=1 Tax=Onchocerca ochengi TaxID=42157 RepID=A0A182E0Y1_ONCOC|nr:unnamed protein product [Onchocerca ochengi]